MSTPSAGWPPGWPSTRSGRSGRPSPSPRRSHVRDATISEASACSVCTAAARRASARARCPAVAATLFVTGVPGQRDAARGLEQRLATGRARPATCCTRTRGPPRPCPIALTMPSTGDASVPFGTTRSAPSIRLMPGNAWSAMVVAFVSDTFFASGTYPECSRRSDARCVADRPRYGARVIGLRHGVLDLEVVGQHRLRRHRHRQHLAVPVVDPAPQGRNGDRLRQLLAGLVLVLPGPHHLDVDQPGGDQQEDEHEPEAEEPDPPPEDLLRRARAGPPGRQVPPRRLRLAA